MRLLLAILFCSLPVYATTRTAASCSQSDVSTTIGASSDGDTVIIPATGSPCTWTTGVTISGKGLDITGTGTPNTGGGTFGAGTPSTTIIDHVGAGALFKFTSLSIGQTAKVELLTLSASGAGATDGPIQLSGTCTSSGCANVRVDNIVFTTGTWGTPLGSGFCACYTMIDDVFGVVDHNSVSETGAVIFLTQVNYSRWKGVGAYGDNSFASADTFGSAQAMYMENNSVSGVRVSETDASPDGTGNDGVGGGRYVCRFNLIVSMPGDGLCGAHGSGWLGRPRGMRQMEVYYNTIQGPSVGCDSVDGILSGTGYYLSNSIAGTCNKMLALDIARFEMSTTPWNNCDGTQPWDATPFSSSSVCFDQTGRGSASDQYQGSTPVLASNPGTSCTTAGQCFLNPVLDPVYEAGETSTNNADGIDVTTAGAATHVVANRDYYGQVSDVAQTSATSPFNGTTGTGYGTLARRPTTCTTGVGYWATDTGTWNTYNSQQGTLYVCGPTNTWTILYTPYTYPHPLESPSSPLPVSPSATTFVLVVNQNGGSQP